MYGYIYKTTCLIENKIYIGRHKATIFEPQKYIGSGITLSNKIKQYGKENFICECIECCNSIEELKEKEIYWIKKLDATNPKIGYNRTISSDGGDSGWRCIYNSNTTERKLILAADLNKYLNAGWKLYWGSEQQKEAGKNYSRNYYIQHRTKILEQHKEYNITHKKPPRTEYMKEYRKANEGKLKEYQQKYQKEYYKTHKSIIKDKQDKQKAKLISAAWQKQHKDRHAEYQRRWYQKNKEKLKQQYQERKLKKNE